MRLEDIQQVNIHRSGINMVKIISNHNEIIPIDSDDPITKNDLITSIGDKKGVTLCIRTKTGNEKRGGYFFSIEVNEDKITVKTFDGEQLMHDSDCKCVGFSFEEFTEFVNHVSGRIYSEKMFELCTNRLNFKTD